MPKQTSSAEKYRLVKSFRWTIHVAVHENVAIWRKILHATIFSLPNRGFNL